jgi:hypothetical protein
MNRLKDFFEEPQPPDAGDDFHEVESENDFFVVSGETADEIERLLEHRPSPPWIVFHDLSGARHRIQTMHITRISESTAAQRAARREFWRARRLEDKKDRRPWEDDD